MLNSKILEEVLHSAREDPWCQECLEVIHKYEESFLSIRNKLSETEQEQLDLYIGACEAFCDAHIFVAHQLALEQCCAASATDKGSPM